MLLTTHQGFSSTVAVVSMRLSRFAVGVRCSGTLQRDWSCVWIQPCSTAMSLQTKSKTDGSDPCGEGTQGAEEKESLFLPPGSLLALTTFHREVHLFGCSGSAGPVTCTAALHLFLLLFTYSGTRSCPKVPEINHVHVD